MNRKQAATLAAVLTIAGALVELGAIPRKYGPHVALAAAVLALMTP